MLQRSITMVASLAILGASPAWAASLDSPSIVAPVFARCLLANGKDAPGEVTFTFFDSTGSIRCTAERTLPAGGIATATCSALARGFCRVEGQFSKGKTKLTICDAGSAAGALGGCLAAGSTH